MNEDCYIKELSGTIKEYNPIAFDKFATEHPICFQPKKGNWLSPMMFDYYYNSVNDEAITECVKELGL